MVMIGSGSIKINEGFDITPQPFPSLLIITLKLKLSKENGVLLISKIASIKGAHLIFGFKTF